MRRPRRIAGRIAAASVVAGLLIMAGFAGTASASEGVESFSTTLIETHPQTHGILGAGEVKSVVNGEQFKMEVVAGVVPLHDVYLVTVPSTATYVEPGHPLATFADISPGDYLEISGRNTFPALKELEATEIVIRPPVSGLVSTSPSGGSFSIEPLRGPAKTVEVSPSTGYFRAESAPGVSDPLTLADVVPGDHVEVLGPIAGTTVNATGIVVSAPQAGGHPDLRTAFSLESPGEPEAAHNVIFNAPTGVFGNPRAITQCAAPTSRSTAARPTPRPA